MVSILGYDVFALKVHVDSTWAIAFAWSLREAIEEDLLLREGSREMAAEDLALAESDLAATFETLPPE